MKIRVQVVTQIRTKYLRGVATVNAQDVHRRVVIEASSQDVWKKFSRHQHNVVIIELEDADELVLENIEAPETAEDLEEEDE